MADDQSKTEEATPFKLREAKKKGQVSKSVEINSLAILLMFWGATFVFGTSIGSGLSNLMRALLVSSSSVSLTTNSIPEIGFELAGKIVAIMAPLIFVIILAAITVNVVQTGPILSSHPIKPDWKRLNPVQGFKKIFSIKTLFDFAKALLKVASIYLAWVVFGADWLDRIMVSYGMPMDNFVQHWISMANGIMLLLIALLVPLAILDFAFARWDFAKKMRMSTQDIKDEHKKREGDPQIKQKQKQIQKELLKKAAALNNVKDADVIITNPEHIAVALQYIPHEMLAPKVLAMGEDNNAATIRKIARTYSIPIVRNVKLARSLYKNSVIDGFISEKNYNDVAEVLKPIFNKRNQSQLGNDRV